MSKCHSHMTSLCIHHIDVTDFSKLFKVWHMPVYLYICLSIHPAFCQTTAVCLSQPIHLSVHQLDGSNSTISLYVMFSAFNFRKVESNFRQRDHFCQCHSSLHYHIFLLFIFCQFSCSHRKNFESCVSIWQNQSPLKLTHKYRILQPLLCKGCIQ
jgi:hypothetical protein